MDRIINLYALIQLSLFVYIRIFNLKNSAGFARIAGGIGFAVLLTCGVFALGEAAPYARFAVMILAIAVFMGKMTGTRFEMALAGTVISVGISYGAALISVVVSSFIIYLFSGSTHNMLMALLSVTAQTAFIVFLFRIRRFRKGILFLQTKEDGAAGVVIGCVILAAITLIGGADAAKSVEWGLIAAAIICVAGLIFWWRRGLTRLYRERIRERDIREYERIIDEKDRQIQKLREINEFMAKLIHRDNKLLPAMYETVRAFSDDCAARGARCEGLLIMSRIDELIRERTGIITQNQRENRILPKTEDSLIDGAMSHMLSKASEEGIQFDITVVGSISALTETVIPAIKLETVFADLIENAIIAASSSEYKRILITLGACGGVYELSVNDTGVPFETYTLMDLGKRKASTRLDNGGSGIGYMAVFEILREFGASIIITEYKPQKYGFTKSVRIRFDGRGEYLVYTYRADEFFAGCAGADGDFPRVSGIV